MKKIQTMIAGALMGVLFAGSADAAPVIWADLTSVDFGTDTVTGTLDGVNFTFSTSGDLFNTTSTGAGINYWADTNSTYTSPPAADNGPATADIIALSGNAGSPADIYTITFDAPVTNLYLAVLSLGSSGDSASYVFNQSFTLLNSGEGHFGGNANALTQNGNTLLGVEGHGLIQFTGVFSSFSWTIPDPETWHGITLGVTRAATQEDIGNANNVPAPAALSLLGLGAITVGAKRRKR